MSHGDSSQPTSFSAVDARCAEAMQLQIAGRSDQAESIYREILGSAPRHAAANHCLGMLEVQRRRAAQGLPYLLTALEESPQLPDYWLGYLEALRLAGRTTEAREALELATRHGLNGAAVAEFAARLDAAAAPSSRVEQVDAGNRAGPTRAERRREEQRARQQESELLKLVSQLRFAAALEMARAISERFPSRGLAWKIAGALLWAQGSMDESLAAMRTALRLLPEDAELHANLGAVLTKAERLEEAEAAPCAAPGR